jgi:hypothetical protein
MKMRSPRKKAVPRYFVVVALKPRPASRQISLFFR